MRDKNQKSNIKNQRFSKTAYWAVFDCERVTGFAPVLKPWKSFVLLLHHTRTFRGTQIRTGTKCSQSIRATVTPYPDFLDFNREMLFSQFGLVDEDILQLCYN